MGIKRKILLGFISIGSLLFLSGIISTLELIRFNNSTHELLDKNRTNIELSRQMLDAVQEQNTALLMNITDSTHVSHDSILLASRKMFAQSLEKAEANFADSPRLVQLKLANEQYNRVVIDIADTITVEWFSQIYKTSYYKLTNSIKEFMVGTQQQIIEYTAALEENAYRATMVGIIALAACFLLIVMFYYLINRFFISPVLAMQTRLEQHLKLGVTFDVQVNTDDEIKLLAQNITRVIEKSKR